MKEYGKDVITGLIGGFIKIFTLAILTNLTSSEWLMAPFGASCVLAFGMLYHYHHQEISLAAILFLVLWV